MTHRDVEVVMTDDAALDGRTGRGVPGAIAALGELRPDVIHVFGLARSPQLAAIAEFSRRAGARLSASFHGGAPPRNPIARALQRRALADIAAMFFPAAHYASEWRHRGVIASRTHIVIAPEVSSPFTRVERDQARAELGVGDELVLAWSGRLHPVKDPLTALRAFERVVAQRPGARLLMAYRSSELLGDVSRFLEVRPAVQDRVRLLGEWPHERMATLFSAADLFVQSSLREYGGNSLVEAMSCGAVPVVTDIPSFRALTDGGRLARLFSAGDAAAMARAITTLADEERRTLSTSICRYFDEQLSYAALARVYEQTFAAMGGKS